MRWKFPKNATWKERYGKLPLFPLLDVYRFNWGSPRMNRRVREMLDYGERRPEDQELNDVTRDLLNNVSVAAVALTGFLRSISELHDVAVKQNDEEKKYVCYVRFKIFLRLAEIMSFGQTGPTRRSTFNLFWHRKLKWREYIFLHYNKYNYDDECINDFPSTPEQVDKAMKECKLDPERKKELEKIHGDLNEFVIR